MSERLDVVTIGNAIVDVLARTDDAFLKAHGLNKGSMALITPEQAKVLYDAMGPAVEVSGGSAANTAAGVASLGGTAGFIGKVADDQLGGVFSHDIHSAGVAFTTAPLEGSDPTAVSYILITPDAQRTMNTYLGACQALGPDDVDEAMVRNAGITYLEGYLWDPPSAKEAFRKAMDIARAAGGRSALTLSDMFCVDRYRDEFIHLFENHLDILFANEHEIMALFGVDDFAEAAARAHGGADIVVVTRSEQGSVVFANGDVIEVPARPTEVVDTTGAGDLYAAGFLYGLSRGLLLAQCADIGGLCAAEIISHVGARSERSLKELVAEILG